MNTDSNHADRAAGCIVGAFIGDALGLGPHWYYDLDELRRDFGPWIDGYTTPLASRKYHAGMKAGELSQTGIIMQILLLPSWIAQAAQDPDIRIEPAWKISLVHGMSCAINFVLPAAYHSAVRFSGDFESAVLHAINGGGQNMSRACLTGALVGAQVGLSGIPDRFIDGLIDGQEIVALAQKVAASASRANTEIQST